jgi:hypothetical protein
MYRPITNVAKEEKYVTYLLAKGVTTYVVSLLHQSKRSHKLF